MPSCAVKCCKNNSSAQKKNQGITFHRFPLRNVTWKKDWINILRKCRNEKNWMPSNKTVLCSTHFDDSDLYTTKNGLRRVVTFAIPRKLLFKQSTGPEEPTEPAITRASQKTLVTSEVIAVKIEQASSREHSVSSRTTSPIPQNSPVTEEASAELEEKQSSLEQSDTSGTTSPTPSETPLALDTAANFEECIPLEAPRNWRFNEELVRKQTVVIKRQKIKIKTLNQKVRRLQERNNSLKYRLKKLKKAASFNVLE